jgi:cytochrome c peroxidase
MAQRPALPPPFRGVLGAVLLGGVAAAGCGSRLDAAFCPNGNCGWSQVESDRISALADLPAAPPVDLSNRYVGNAAALDLGRKFFFDPRFSGTSAMTDALQRPVPFARAPKGQPLNIACATCHDLTSGAADPSTVPGNVSLGATWTDTNASSLWNAGFQKLLLWNGRADSLWAQATATIETAMGSNRLRAAWTIADLYRSDYEAVFTDYPLPMSGTSADLAPSLQTTGATAGQCQPNADGSCPVAAGCREAHDDAGVTTGCWPRFPLDGKPGAKAGCQPGDTTEPFGDAFDCMDPNDQSAATRVAVNFGKAIAAFEYQLVSRNSPFDRFVADLRQGRADESDAISADAKNGARLFVGKAGCSDCHNTPLFSDGSFYNVGVLQVGQGVPTLDDCPAGGVCDCASPTPKNCLPFGAYDGIQKLRKSPYRRDSMWSDDPADDSRKSFLDAPIDSFPKGGFRVPGLRSVALSPPYMHDGALATLDDVVALYDRGGDPVPGGVRAARIKPLMLAAEERAQLVAFLKALTGDPLPSDFVRPPTLPPPLAR